MMSYVEVDCQQSQQMLANVQSFFLVLHFAGVLEIKKTHDIEALSDTERRFADSF